MALQGITGSLGACISTTATYPIEVVKTRIQANAGGNSGFIKIFLNIIKKEGFRGLFVGLSSQYVQTLLANFFFFYFYSKYRKQAQKMYQNRKVCTKHQHNN